MGTTNNAAGREVLFLPDRDKPEKIFATEVAEDSEKHSVF
jgi:hypothetical protein